jgi:Concanavalin A-like lectin/glucanases superfamily
MHDFDHGFEDKSTFNNDIIDEFTNNQPIFVAGPTGIGFQISFNANSDTTYDKLWIPFSNSTQIVYDVTGGFSVFMRIAASFLTLTPAGQMRCLWQKMDDLDNGAQARLGPDGTLYFTVKKAGVEYKVKTPTGVITASTSYVVWFVWDTNTNTPKIYVDNTGYTTASTTVFAWNNTHSHFILGNYNLGMTQALAGAFRGTLDEFRLYRMVVSSTQVNNFDTNGFTITDAGTPDPTHPVFIVNRVKIDSRAFTQEVYVEGDVILDDVLTDPAATSFTSASFTSTSFTTA